LHFSFFIFHFSLFTQKPLHPRRLDILFDIQPKRHKEVDDKRRSEGDEGQINEIQPDPGRIDTHPLAELLANAECGFFQEVTVAIKEIFYVVE
jgi:hypothetical protein